jgi:MFS family permease
MMLVHMSLTGGRVAVLLTGIHLGMNTFDVGLLVAFFALLPMVLAVFAGRFLDRIGPFRPMRAGVIMAFVGIFLPLVWQHWIALTIAALSVGVGHMIFQLGIQGQLGLGEAAQRLRNYSWLALALAISGFSGPLLSGLSIDYLGHRWAFGLLAISPLIALFGLIKMRVVLGTAPKTLKPPGPQDPPASKQRVADLFKIRPLKYAFGANLLLAGAWDTHMFLVPIYGVQRDLSATTIGLILASFALATFLIRTVLPWIQRHASPWQLIHIAMITAGLNFMIYPLFSEVWLLMTLSFILGLSLGCTQPGILSLLQQHAPDGRKAEAFGVRMSLVNGSQVFLPIAFGALGTALGVMPLFWATAAAVMSGAWLTRRAGREPAIPPTKPSS